MFSHNKELQFDARVSGPDPRFANMLLEQFGGGNGELKAAMQYFVQSFSARKPYPEMYDLLMDIATEELSHLEIVGATITMLLDGISGELRDAADQSYITRLGGKGNGQKDDLIHQALANPHFFNLTGGAPELHDSRGVPWTASFVNANGDLTVDLRSNIAAESRAKIVYEYLMQFTDDVLVKETLGFLMTREIAHFQQFAAALSTLQPNFPPGVRQGDARFSHAYFDMSPGEGSGDSPRGPWNEGQGPWRAGEQWQFIADPVSHVAATKGLKDQPAAGGRTPAELSRLEQQVSRKRKSEIKSATKAKGPIGWTDYPG